MDRNDSQATTVTEGPISHANSVSSTTPLQGQKYSNDQVTGAASLTTKQTVRPLLLMCFTSLLLGMSTGVTMGQSKAFQNALGISRGTVSWLEIGYFAPFLVMPWTFGLFMTRKFGYRKALGTSFLLLGIGHAGYWPASTYRSFPAFCVSAAICGTGVSTGLAAKIPYCASIGPKRNSEMRTLIMNATYSMSILLGQLISVFVIYQDKQVKLGKGSIIPIQWAHVSCSAADMFLALVFFLVSLPEITDADMEADSASKAATTGWVSKPLRAQPLFWVGCLGAFFYDGAQIAIAAFFIQFIEEVLPDTTDRRAASLLMGAVALGILSKALTTGAVSIVRPRLIVAAAFVAMITSISIAIPVGGRPAAALFLFEGFARAPVGILMFTIALRGLGKHTKLGAAILTSMAGGAVAVVPLAGYLSQRIPLRIAMSGPLGALAVSSIFALYINTAKAKELDLIRVAERREKSAQEPRVRRWFGMRRAEEQPDEEKQGSRRSLRCW